MLYKWIEKIHSSEKGVVLTLLRSVLWVVSLGYRLALAVRNDCYDTCLQLKRGIGINWLRVEVHKFKPQVISIGNIVAGGTGKTPPYYFNCA